MPPRRADRVAIREAGCAEELRVEQCKAAIRDGVCVSDPLSCEPKGVASCHHSAQLSSALRTVALPSDPSAAGFVIEICHSSHSPTPMICSGMGGVTGERASGLEWTTDGTTGRGADCSGSAAGRADGTPGGSRGGQERKTQQQEEHQARESE